MAGREMTNSEFETLLHLSRLESGDERLHALKDQMRSIIEYFDLLEKYDVSGIGDDFSGAVAAESMRKDEVEKGLESRDLKLFGKFYLDGYFAVPKIIETGE